MGFNFILKPNMQTTYATIEHESLQNDSLNAISVNFDHEARFVFRKVKQTV